ncbi:MAG TPA: helix-turn-helix transcriptional regulator [Jatrophihabitantaceae bacterium]|jgi:AraC-like DNA-binding protein/quercetin dioxygenase-like cupin family protein
MSPTGQVGSAAVLVATFAMGPTTRYVRHVHDEHQLAWAPRGVLTVETDTATWVLPPTRALWIPSGVPHETSADGTATMRALYLHPAACPVEWTSPQPVVAMPVLAELIHHLAETPLDPGQRKRAEAVLLDLLEPVAVATIDGPMPRDARAVDVARALLDDPADQRSLEDWGRHVGASARTLARAFRADTGVGFARWRTLARIRAALPLLAAGQPVGNVARRVGYDTASAFVAAFRRETGVTPGAYFHS